jgi:hypothetical protein
MHILCSSIFPKSIVNPTNESYHAPIPFLTPVYLGILKLQGYGYLCITRNRDVLTSMLQQTGINNSEVHMNPPVWWYIIQIMNVYVKNMVKDEILPFHSTVASCPSFTEWKYFYHCTNESILYLFYLTPK